METAGWMAQENLEHGHRSGYEGRVGRKQSSIAEAIAPEKIVPQKHCHPSLRRHARGSNTTLPSRSEGSAFAQLEEKADPSARNGNSWNKKFFAAVEGMTIWGKKTMERGKSKNRLWCVMTAPGDGLHHPIHNRSRPQTLPARCHWSGRDASFGDRGPRLRSDPRFCRPTPE